VSVIPERLVEAKLVNAASERGVWCVKLTVLGISGFPDRLCLAPGGRIAFIEVKRPGEVPRPLQVMIHKKLRALGFIVEVIDRREDCAPFFRRWLGVD